MSDPLLQLCGRNWTVAILVDFIHNFSARKYVRNIKLCNYRATQHCTRELTLVFSLLLFWRDGRISLILLSLGRPHGHTGHYGRVLLLPSNAALPTNPSVLLYAVASLDLRGKKGRESMEALGRRHPFRRTSPHCWYQDTHNQQKAAQRPHVCKFHLAIGREVASW